MDSSFNQVAHRLAERIHLLALAGGTCGPWLASWGIDLLYGRVLGSR